MFFFQRKTIRNSNPQFFYKLVLKWCSVSRLYRERITQIETKLNEVRAGQAAEYLQPLEELQINMKNRMEVGGVLRELRLKNITCKYEAEELAAHQNFEVK